MSTFRLYVWISASDKVEFMSVQHIDVAQRNRLFRFTQAGALWTDPRAGEADPKSFTAHHSSTKIPRRDQNLNECYFEQCYFEQCCCIFLLYPGLLRVSDDDDDDDDDGDLK